MWFTEVAARPGGKPTKCNIGLWGTVCLGTLSIRLTCEVSCFPIFLKIISAAASIFITQKNHFPRLSTSNPSWHESTSMSQYFLLRFCVQHLPLSFHFSKLRLPFFQFWASPDLLQVLSTLDLDTGPSSDLEVAPSGLENSTDQTSAPQPKTSWNSSRPFLPASHSFSRHVGMSHGFDLVAKQHQ